MNANILDNFMSSKKHCVVVPVFESTITDEEKLAIAQLVKIVKSADIYLIYPKGLDLTVYYEVTNNFPFKLTEFAPRHFSSTQEYSRLLESSSFYKKYSKYEYMLIYQLDCWIFEDRIDYFAKMGYDYYGSPWIVDNKNHIGNGGFSLRKISKFIDFTASHKNEFYPIEDRYFCELHQDDFNLCSYEVGCEFGLCNYADYDQLAEINAGRMKCPMGMHKMLDERIINLFFKYVNNETGNKFPPEYASYMKFNNTVATANLKSTKSAMLAILNNIK